MKTVRLSNFAVVLVLLCISYSTAAVASYPSGQYCGSYGWGVITGTVTFAGGGRKLVDISISAPAGMSATCRNVRWDMDALSGVVGLDGLDTRGTCIYNLITDHGLRFGGKYSAAQDTLDIDLGYTSLVASKC